jgi:hypothetical protein
VINGFTVEVPRRDGRQREERAMKRIELGFPGEGR